MPAIGPGAGMTIACQLVLPFCTTEALQQPAANLSFYSSVQQHVALTGPSKENALRQKCVKPNCYKGCDLNYTLFYLPASAYLGCPSLTFSGERGRESLLGAGQPKFYKDDLAPLQRKILIPLRAGPYMNFGGQIIQHPVVKTPSHIWAIWPQTYGLEHRQGQNLTLSLHNSAV